MQHSTTRRAGLALAAALIITSLMPTATSEPSEPSLVGHLLVDARGHATGANLAATLTEANGLVSSFSAHGRDVFDAVEVDGFDATAKLAGVGTPSLFLDGDAATLALHDDANAILRLVAHESTVARFDLAPGIVAVQRSSHQIDLATRADELVGSLVTATGSLSAGGGVARADLFAGDSVAFLAKPASLRSDAYFQAMTDALARGELAGSFVAEWSRGAVAGSAAQLGAHAFAPLAREGRVEAALPRADDVVLLSFDLAYETLHARSGGDVAVFADGRLLQRAQSADEVVALARQDIASSFALVQDGRASILAAAPEGAAELSLFATGRAPTQAQARAEGAASSNARVAGDLLFAANGKLLGDFLTGSIVPGRAALSHYATVESGEEIFRSVSVEGNRASLVRHMEDARLRVEGSRADITLVDDAYATLVVEGKTKSNALFALAEGVVAESVTPSLVKLSADGETVGWLIALPGARGLAQLDGSIDGEIVATLEKGARIVFRGATDSFDSEPAVARALAQGDVGAQILAGWQQGEVATSVAEHVEGAHAKIVTASRGALEADYSAKLGSAKTLILDTRGAALPAKSADDLRVLVDGQLATQVSSADAALAPASVAKWFAETSDDGSVRLILNTAAKAGAPVRVLVQSKLASVAREAGGADAFGSFKVFSDGSAVGDFVSLEADQASGAISGFSVAPEGEVFSSLAAGGSPFFALPTSGAATLLIENKETRLEVADATTGFLRVLAKQDTSAALSISDKLVAAKRGAGVIEIVDEANAHVGSLLLVGEGSLSLVENDVTAELARGAQLVYKSHVGIDRELSSAQLDMIGQAIAKGKVAGQVLVQTGSGDIPLEAGSLGMSDAIGLSASQLAGRVTSTVATSFTGDVQMLASATKDRVDVTLSSATSEGKTLLISLDKATLPGLPQGEAQVLFDGAAIGQASSYADVLDALDDEGVAEYFVLAGEAGSQVLVSVPHFSVHTVTLEPRSSASASLYPYATVFLGLLVLAQSVLLVRRRKA